MAQFSYKARRRSGEIVQGVLDVVDRAAALLQIEKMGLFPVVVDAMKGGAAPVPAAAAERSNGGGRSSLANLLPLAVRQAMNRQRKPKLQELATYTQQLANLLQAGMPLTVALNSMTHLESKGISSEISKQLKQDVMEGKGLSEAMRKQPLIFSDLYVNMVRAGEQSGALVDVLRRLASHYERFAEVQSKFGAALIYPAIVMSVGVVIVIFFMTFMLPKFLTIFQGLRIPLPWATRFLIGLSNGFSSYWWVLILVVIAIVVLWQRFKATEDGKRKIDEWKMSAPVLGKVIRLNIFGQFARTLSTLLVNGVPVLTALQITEQIVPNRVVKEAIAKTRDAVTDGKSLALPLAQSKIFPQLMIDLIKIGEETGDVPGALKNVAETYENELSIALRVMTNLIEPALIIVMAVMVGFLLFSVLSAMFSITANINR
ncbi:MAG: type II secretion system F family protein [Verrucomicrobia bacterium]|nr:type II secretion system F family protein [Verrucomicrobiota bacterium]